MTQFRNIFCSVFALAVSISACLPFFGPTPTVALPAPIPTNAPATATAAPSATSTSTATVPAVGGQRGPQRIEFSSGSTKATIQGNLAPKGMDSYVVQVLAGQSLSANIASQAKVLLQISGADGSPLKTYGAGGASWSGTVPTTQDYMIGITTEDGSAASYILVVATGTLATLPAQQAAPRRIQFPPGGITSTVQGNLGTNGLDVHVLRALAGQTMTVDVTASQPMLLAVSGADGSVLKSSGAGGSGWTGVLPTTQDYMIAVSAATGAPTSYTLQITIPPRTP